jgi:hypothetical protein
MLSSLFSKKKPSDNNKSDVKLHQWMQKNADPRLLYTLSGEKKWSQLLSCLPTATEEQIKFKTPGGGWGVLHNICFNNGPPDIAKHLLDLNLLDVNDPIANGSTPVFIAVENNASRDLLFTLLDYGGDPNRPTKDGCTPIFSACENGSAQSLVRLLIQAGARYDITHQGALPINVARFKNHPDLVYILTSPPPIDLTMFRKPASVMMMMMSTTAVNNNNNIPFAIASGGGQQQQLHQFKYDAFLSHNWGENNINHQQVGMINNYLKSAGLRTWFDEENMSGNAVMHDMAKGIDESRKVIVFITAGYMAKVESDNRTDNCQLEFSYSTRTKGGALNMIPVIMEPGLRDVSRWTGPVGLVLGGALYFDLSMIGSSSSGNGNEWETVLKALIEAIRV